MNDTDFAYLTKYWLRIVGRRKPEPSEDLGLPPVNSLADLHNGGGGPGIQGCTGAVHHGISGYTGIPWYTGGALVYHGIQGVHRGRGSLAHNEGVALLPAHCSLLAAIFSSNVCSGVPCGGEAPFCFLTFIHSS